MKVVIGLGMTGLSCIDYLCAEGHDVVAMDSVATPPGLNDLQTRFPNVPVVLGKLDPVVLAQADEIVVSPGVPLALPEIQQATKRSIPVVGDVELFARRVRAPLYGITGSNGKTTVTTLLGEMASAAAVKMQTGGNIGTPVLDLLKQESLQGYILELSSFQLETTYSMRPKAAVVLNVSDDHMDRYEDFNAYKAAKCKIYHNCDYPIVNADEPGIWSGLSFQNSPITFSVKQEKADYSVKRDGNRTFLLKRGKKIIDADLLPLKGEHHWQNTLCALAFGEVMGLPLESMCEVLQRFQGLPHRCQLVRTKNGVTWYNDSKGTNVGATRTAITSVASHTAGKIILIAGGLGKGADFTTLNPVVSAHVRDVILIGQDAPLLAEALNHSATIHVATSLKEAVLLAVQRAAPQDAVLLSPACASFDMFSGYADRGNQFVTLVSGL